MNFVQKIRKVLSFDEWVRMRALHRLSRLLLPDNRLTWPHLDWFRDADFNSYLRRFDQEDDFNAHRHWMLWQLLRLNAQVKGDTAECGVFKGASSWLMCAGNRAQAFRRTHHLFDSFEGLSEPELQDGGHWRRGQLATGEAAVLRNLYPFVGEVELHKGWIPDRFKDVADKVFAFVHIDVDLYQPTFDSIAFFYERMSDGGIILCDDYGFSTCPGATKAVDDFLADKPEKMIALSSGAGMIIKNRATSPQFSVLP